MDSLPESWADMRLDSRIVEALKDLKWKAPTSIQRACIPHALRGNDMSLQSRTGSGKTGAFVIPMVQRLLLDVERSKKGSMRKKPTGLVLVPSVELCEQTMEASLAICKYVNPRVVIENLCTKGSVNDARILAADIVVSTAALLAKHIRSGQVTEASFANLRMVVIDEADMMVSIAEKSLRAVQSLLPTTVQGILCSATLTEGVASIKGQLLHSPVNIVLTNDDTDVAPTKGKKREREAATAEEPIVESHITLKDNTKKTLKQYYLVATDECHKHTLIFALYRLKLIEGKTIVFMDDEEDTYRLEHFLQQLGVSCVVYDVTLPTNVRLDILRRFQKGEVATLICTDNTLESAERMQLTIDEDVEKEEDIGDDANQGKKKSRKEGVTPNSALHRGVDFNKVRNVIIFDGMDSPSAINYAKYTHRVGRTGRAGEVGNSIILLSMPQTHKVLGALREHIKDKGDHLRPFKQLDRTEASKLQYRVDTVLANVTRTATRKLRVATVASELARSSFLSTHLSQKDTEALEKIVKRSARTVKCDKNVLHVPSYMAIKTDDAKTYANRVNLTERKEQAFAAVTKKKYADPLKAVVAKVRQTKRTAKK